jgi:hypothetical protein
MIHLVRQIGPGLCDPGDLAHVLTRCCFDLFTRGWRFEAAKFSDISAHFLSVTQKMVRGLESTRDLDALPIASSTPAQRGRMPARNVAIPKRRPPTM